MSQPTSTEQHSLQTVSDALSFGEGPRWREGELWFSDILGHAVKKMRSDGVVETVFDFDGHPSGLGWLPGGELLVVSMLDRQLFKWDGSELALYAEMDDLASGKANDMVVDQHTHRV